jgi:hypothetical protein
MSGIDQHELDFLIDGQLDRLFGQTLGLFELAGGEGGLGRGLFLVDLPQLVLIGGHLVHTLLLQGADAVFHAQLQLRALFLGLPGRLGMTLFLGDQPIDGVTIGRFQLAVQGQSGVQQGDRAI